MGHGKSFTDNPRIDPATLKGSFNLAAGLGLGGVAVSLIALTLGDEAKAQFFYSWLVAFWVFTTIALGALFFTVLHHLVRASWSTGFRRIAENIAANLPLMALLFVPVLIGMHDLYHWTHADAVAADPILKWKSGYLNTPFFIARAVGFFALWCGLAWFYRSNSVKQDASGDIALSFKMRKMAPVATLVFALTITFAAFDWMMSLDPHWFSTMFGVYSFAGTMMSAYATLALVAMWLQRKGALRNTITVGNLHDAGKMMFGFMVFWTYVAFCQYYLIWYANIPEETVWYRLRLENGWEKISLLVLLGHFIVPFWFLMSRHVKRNRTLLGLGAAWMLFMHFVDIYFVAMPVLHDHGPHFHWLDITTLVGIGGLFSAMVIRRFMTDAAVAYKDPQLIASMEYDNG